MRVGWVGRKIQVKGGEVDMKLLNWGKIALWLALIAFFSWLLSQRYSSIMEGTSNSTDIVIFLIWVALIAVFVFQEVDFFGVRLKREIKNLRAGLSEIRNIINMRAEMSQQIFLTPPPDSELQDIKRELKSTLERIKEKGLEKPTAKPEIPDDNRFLFEVRYTIEKELRRIWKQYQTEVTARSWAKPWSAELERPQSAFQITRSLDELGIIAPELSSVIREVYRVCTPAMHGEEVSQTAVGFAKDVAPGLIASLKATEVTFKPKKEEQT
jgi:hypothetical protein